MMSAHTGPRCSHCLKFEDFLPISFLTRYVYQRRTRAGKMIRWKLRQFCSERCETAFMAARPGVQVRDLAA